MDKERKKYRSEDFLAMTIDERLFLTHVELLNVLEEIRYELWKSNERK